MSYQNYKFQQRQEKNHEKGYYEQSDRMMARRIQRYLTERFGSHYKEFFKSLSMNELNTVYYGISQKLENKSVIEILDGIVETTPSLQPKYRTFNLKKLMI